MLNLSNESEKRQGWRSNIFLEYTFFKEEGHESDNQNDGSILYIDGTDQTFEWEPDTEQVESATMLSRLQKSLHEEYILIETGDQFMIIPKQNIKTITINAVPPQLPPSAIRGARLVNS
ncbi:MAG: hypothetical protein AAGD25_12770 [Cyanobacteria bacterium P01_F01_bin.150]